LKNTTAATAATAAAAGTNTTANGGWVCCASTNICFDFHFEFLSVEAQGRHFSNSAIYSHSILTIRFRRSDQPVAADKGAYQDLYQRNALHGHLF
jgi:hypothetical protein